MHMHYAVLSSSRFGREIPEFRSCLTISEIFQNFKIFEARARGEKTQNIGTNKSEDLFREENFYSALRKPFFCRNTFLLF